MPFGGKPSRPRRDGRCGNGRVPAGEDQAGLQRHRLEHECGQADEVKRSVGQLQRTAWRIRITGFESLPSELLDQEVPGFAEALR